jgi:hypothetical protein
MRKADATINATDFRVFAAKMYPCLNILPASLKVQRSESFGLSHPIH